MMAADGLPMKPHESISVVATEISWDYQGRSALLMLLCAAVNTLTCPTASECLYTHANAMAKLPMFIRLGRSNVCHTGSVDAARAVLPCCIEVLNGVMPQLHAGHQDLSYLLPSQLESNQEGFRPFRDQLKSDSMEPKTCQPSCDSKARQYPCPTVCNLMLAWLHWLFPCHLYHCLPP